MRLRLAAAILLAQSLCATAVLGGDITSGSLQIQGVSLEIDTPAVTTGIDIPTTIQTKFGGKTNDAAPLVEGLTAVADLTGPGLDAPIQLTTAPGYRFQIPGFKTEGIYRRLDQRTLPPDPARWPWLRRSNRGHAHRADRCHEDQSPLPDL